MKIFSIVCVILCFFVFACQRKDSQVSHDPDPLPPGFVEVTCECPQPEKIVVVGGRGASRDEAEKNALDKCQEITSHKISSVEGCEDGPLGVLKKKLREHHEKYKKQKKDSSE